MTERLAGRRILVVEDEVILAWALQDMLGGYGCVVVGPAAGVADALALIERETIDAAVLDVNLNREKCYPVADALVQKGIPFVFSTAYSAESIEEGYRRHPSIQKPHSAPELADMLSSLLPDLPAAPFPVEAALCAAGVGLWAFDPRRDALELDPVAQALLGLPAGPMALKALLTLVHPDDKAPLQAHFAKRDPTPSPTTQDVGFRLVSAEGPRHFRLRGGSPAEGGRSLGALLPAEPG
jgi:CheY-like chemotaxis protein